MFMLFGVLPILRSGMSTVHVYIAPVTLQLSNDRFNDLCAQLQPKEWERVLRFKRWQDAHATLYGRLLLAKAAADYGLTLEDVKYTEYAKPYFEGSFDFNIAHSGKLVVCAFSNTTRVGVDVEAIRLINVNDFNSVFTSGELASINDPVAFFTTWTRKEAIIKADGSGLNLELDKIDTMADSVVLNGTTWHLKTIHSDREHIMSICSDKQDFEIVIERVGFT